VQSQSTHSPETNARRRRKIKTPWIVAGVVLILILGFWLRSRSKKPAEPQVQTATVSVANVSATVSATGTLQPFTAVDVKSRASGTVLNMAVEEGSVVKKGQLICLIDRQDTLEAYQQAEASVNSAKAALAQAQANAQLQNSSIGPQIRQSAQALAAAQAKVKQSQETLSVQKVTSKTDIQQAQSNVKAAQAKLAQAKASATAQPSLTTSAIAQAQANVDASKANLDSAQQALAVEQNATLPQQAAAVQAQVNLANSAVKTAQLDLQRQEGLLAKGYVAQTTVDASRNQLIAAQSTLKTAQAQLDTLKNQQSAQLQDFKARVQAAQGSLQQAQAGLKTAQTNSVQNVVAQKNVVAAEAALKQSQAALASAIANQRQVEVQQAGVESAQAQARQAQAALQGAKANTTLSSVRAQDIVQAQSKLSAAQITAKNALLNLDQTRVVAPSDGIILKKYVDAGTIIQSGNSGFSGGTAIVNLANVSRMYVDVEVDEADIARVKTGQPVAITLDAYPDSIKHGVVRKVYPEAEVDQNVTYVHAQVEVNKKDVNSQLRPLMNATCDFTVAQAKDVLAVPSEAIKDVGEKSAVTVIKDPRKPLWEKSNQEQKIVTLGVVGDNLTQVTSGLKKGDLVVTKITLPPGADSGTGGPGGGSGRGRGLGRF
jgi:HlyD family secretion protein